MQTLKRGERGAEVALLQTGLVRAGFGPLRPDGVFGRDTERALRAFQQKNGLRADAVAGPRTEQALAPWLRGCTVHTVVRGDTLWRIASRYDTTLSALESANPALDPFDLRIGQRLTVPFDFAVTPTDIPWSSAANEYCIEGLLARYPGALSAEIIGRSVRGRPIRALTVGAGPRRAIFNAAHHANEWITAPLLMKYAESLLAALAAGETLGGAAAEDIAEACRLTLIPLVNPDGADLVTGALEEPWLSRAAAIAAPWPDIPFPEGWKANLEGIDLNLQYPALWETARENKFAAGVTAPAPQDYVGPAPLLHYLYCPSK